MKSPARIAVVLLPDGGRTPVYLWCAWKAPKYRRAPDAAGLRIGTLGARVQIADILAEREARAALGELGAAAERVDPLASPILRTYLAGPRRVPNFDDDGNATLDPPEPAPPIPTYSVSVYTTAAGATWCVWLGKPSGEPLARGFKRSDRDFLSESQAYWAASDYVRAREGRERTVSSEFARPYMAAEQAGQRVGPCGGAPPVFLTGAWRSRGAGYDWGLWLNPSAALSGAEPIAWGSEGDLKDALRVGSTAAAERGAMAAWQSYDTSAAVWAAFDRRRGTSSAPAAHAWDAPPANALASLGLTWPCARADVLAAYKRRAFDTHPDRGGTDAAFIAVGRARDEILRALGGDR